MLLELGVVPFGPVLAQKVPFGTIQAHLGPYGPVWYPRLGYNPKRRHPSFRYSLHDECLQFSDIAPACITPQVPT